MAETLDIKIGDVTLSRNYAGTLRSFLDTVLDSSTMTSDEYWGWNAGVNLGAYLAAVWMEEELVYTYDEYPEDSQYLEDIHNPSQAPEWRAGYFNVYIKGQVSGGSEQSVLVGSYDLGWQWIGNGYDIWQATYPDWDETATFEFEISGTFEKRAKITYNNPVDNDYIHDAYSESGRSVAGPVPVTEMEYYYVPPASCDYTLELEGSTVDSGTVSAGDDQGLGMYRVEGFTETMSDAGPEVTQEELLAVDVTMSGSMPIGSISGSHEEITEGGITYGYRCVGNAGNFKLYAYGWPTAYPYPPKLPLCYEIEAPAATFTHAGSVKHWDNTATAGIELVIGETDNPTATTDVDGSFSKAVSYDGIWRVGWRFSPSVWYGDESNDYNTEHTAPGVSNPYAKAVPYFDTERETLWSKNYFGWGDHVCVFEEPEALFGWPDALTVSAEQAKDVTEFVGAASWSVTSGAAAITDVGGSLQVVVTSDCTIERSFASDQWAGARFADILHTSDDSGEITIEAAGRQYAFTSSDYRIDLACPSNIDGADTTNMLVGVTAPGWSWGIHSPGTVKLIGLRAGKTYTFTKVQLRRLSAEEGGYIKVYVNPHGPFVGSRIGDNRIEDVKQIEFSQSGNETVYAQQTGLVIVDGIVAAELSCIRHQMLLVAGWEENWYHPAMSIDDDESILFPHDGLVQMSLGETDSGWRTTDANAAWLKQGIYTDWDNVGIDAAVNPRRVIMPYEMGGCSFAVSKKLWGLGLFLLVDSGGVLRSRGVHVKSYLRNGGTFVSNTGNKLTDPLGFVQLPSLPQPHYERWTIEEVALDGTTVTVSGLARTYSDYEGCELFIPLAGDEPPAHNTIASITSGGVITLGSAITPADVLGTYVYCYLDYYHELIVSGLAFDPATGELHYDPVSGQLHYVVFNGPQLDYRNHAAVWAAFKGDLS